MANRCSSAVTLSPLPACFAMRMCSGRSSSTVRSGFGKSGGQSPRVATASFFGEAEGEGAGPSVQLTDIVVPGRVRGVYA